MKKFLVVFGNGCYDRNLLKTAKFLQERFECTVSYLFIRDIMKEERMAVGLENVYSTKAGSNFQTILNIENKRLLDIKNLFKEYDIKDEIQVANGIFAEIVNENMKLNDMLLLDKDISLNDGIVAVLKNRYKPIILISDKAITCFDKICISNDDGIKINRSCYEFMQNFPKIENFTSILIENNREKTGDLVKYMRAKGKNLDEVEVKNIDSALEIMNQADITVMGTLSSSFFIEKIIGKNGLKLLEKIESALFIG